MRLLDSLEHSHEAAANEIEVVVVVDGSTDASSDAVRSRPVAPFAVELVEQPNAGLAAARNAGAARARAPWLWFLDDDMEVGPAAVAAHTLPLGPRVIRMGPAVPAPELDAVAASYYRVRHARLAGAGRVTNPFDFSGANTSMSADLFATLGGYDERFRRYGAEDYELAQRALESGVDICFEPQAGACHHGVKSTTARLADKRSSWINRSLLLDMHPDLATRVVADLERTRHRRLLQRIGRRSTGILDGYGRLAAVASMRLGHRVPGGGRLERVAIDASQVAGFLEGQRRRRAGSVGDTDG